MWLDSEELWIAQRLSSASLLSSMSADNFDQSPLLKCFPFVAHDPQRPQLSPQRQRIVDTILTQLSIDRRMVAFCAAVPLKIEGNVLGLLCVFSYTEVSDFSVDDISILEDLAGLASDLAPAKSHYQDILPSVNVIVAVTSHLQHPLKQATEAFVSTRELIQACESAEAVTQQHLDRLHASLEALQQAFSLLNYTLEHSLSVGILSMNMSAGLPGRFVSLEGLREYLEQSLIDIASLCKIVVPSRGFVHLRPEISNASVINCSQALVWMALFTIFLNLPSDSVPNMVVRPTIQVRPYFSNNDQSISYRSKSVFSGSSSRRNSVEDDLVDFFGFDLEDDDDEAVPRSPPTLSPPSSSFAMFDTVSIDVQLRFSRACSSAKADPRTSSLHQPHHGHRCASEGAILMQELLRHVGLQNAQVRYHDDADVYTFSVLAACDVVRGSPRSPKVPDSHKSTQGSNRSTPRSSYSNIKASFISRPSPLNVQMANGIAMLSSSSSSSSRHGQFSSRSTMDLSRTRSNSYSQSTQISSNNSRTSSTTATPTVHYLRTLASSSSISASLSSSVHQAAYKLQSPPSTRSWHVSPSHHASAAAVSAAATKSADAAASTSTAISEDAIAALLSMHDAGRPLSTSAAASYATSTANAAVENVVEGSTAAQIPQTP